VPFFRVAARPRVRTQRAARRFTSLTNGFSKKLENIGAAVSLHFAHYNVVRMHKTLKFMPAMAAKIETTPLSLELSPKVGDGLIFQAAVAV